MIYLIVWFSPASPATSITSITSNQHQQRPASTSISIFEPKADNHTPPSPEKTTRTTGLTLNNKNINKGREGRAELLTITWRCGQRANGGRTHRQPKQPEKHSNSNNTPTQTNEVQSVVEIRHDVSPGGRSCKLRLPTVNKSKRE